MADRERRWLGLLIGVVMFSVGAVMFAARGDFGLLPDFCIFMGGAVAMWMTAKLFWTPDPPEWFVFVVSLGWMIVMVFALGMIWPGRVF